MFHRIFMASMTFMVMAFMDIMAFINIMDIIVVLWIRYDHQRKYKNVIINAVIFKLLLLNNDSPSIILNWDMLTLKHVRYKIGLYNNNKRSYFFFFSFKRK